LGGPLNARLEPGNARPVAPALNVPRTGHPRPVAPARAPPPLAPPLNARLEPGNARPVAPALNVPRAGHPRPVAPALNATWPYRPVATARRDRAVAWAPARW